MSTEARPLPVEVDGVNSLGCNDYKVGGLGCMAFLVKQQFAGILNDGF